jgi:hypothetical protein
MIHEASTETIAGAKTKTKKTTKKILRKLNKIQHIDNTPKGDTMEEKNENDLRFMYQNINSLKSKDNIKWLNVLRET